MYRLNTSVWTFLTLISFNMADIVEETAKEAVEEAEPLFSTLDYVVLGLAGKYFVFNFGKKNVHAILISYVIITNIE